jgi:tetratricopeptide (TPR) repeat protein
MCEAKRAVVVMALVLMPFGGSSVVSARDGNPEAAALLENKGIVRGASGFVLQAESEIRPKLVVLRSRAEASRVAFDEMGQFQWAVARIAELDDAITQTNATIAELGFQMGQFPGTFRGGRTIHGSSMQDEAAFQALKTQRDQMVRNRDASMVLERTTLARQQPGQKLGRATEAAKLRHETALEALGEMRRAVDATTKGYEELANDADVKAALTKLGQAKFGPSPEFLTSVQELQRFEKSVGMKSRPGVQRPARGKPVETAPKNQGDRSVMSSSRLRIAELTEKNGKKREALDLYKQVIKLDPDGEDGKKAAERIKAMSAP